MANSTTQWNHWYPDNSRRAKNIQPEIWELLRGPVCRLHHEGHTKQGILDWITVESGPESRGPTPTMSQLVRQMRTWNLRSDTRQPQIWPSNEEAQVAVLRDTMDFDVPNEELASLPSLTTDQASSGNGSSEHESDSQMLDVYDDPRSLTTMSDICSQSGNSDLGPIVVEGESTLFTPASALDTGLMFTEAASDTSSMFLATKDRTSVAAKLRHLSGERLSESSSIKSTFTISTHSSWSFSRLTGFPSFPRASSSGSRDSLSTTDDSRALNFSRPLKGANASHTMGSSNGGRRRSTLHSIMEASAVDSEEKQRAFYQEGRVFERLYEFSPPASLALCLTDPVSLQSNKFVVVRRWERAYAAVSICERLPRTSIPHFVQCAAMLYDQHLDMSLPAPAEKRMKTITVTSEPEMARDSLPVLGFADFSQCTTNTFCSLWPDNDLGMVSNDSMALLQDFYRRSRFYQLGELKQMYGVLQ